MEYIKQVIHTLDVKYTVYFHEYYLMKFFFFH